MSLRRPADDGCQPSDQVAVNSGTGKAGIGARYPGSAGRWARVAGTEWIMVIGCMARGKIAEELQLVDGFGLKQQPRTILAVNPSPATSSNSSSVMALDR